jgi:hypothetical protein
MGIFGWYATLTIWEKKVKKEKITFVRKMITLSNL